MQWSELVLSGGVATLGSEAVLPSPLEMVHVGESPTRRHLGGCYWRRHRKLLVLGASLSVGTSVMVLVALESLDAPEVDAPETRGVLRKRTMKSRR